jgi:hypothetical protein
MSIIGNNNENYGPLKSYVRTICDALAMIGRCTFTAREICSTTNCSMG